MARPLRIEYPGALYHITSRGNKRQDIFSSDRDRRRFLHMLHSIVQTHHWLCHAYCLMDNHYHLLIQTLEANLSVGMRDLNGIYTQAYNKIHQTVGHIFQGRYKAFVIEKETYFLEVARYTVLNPVRSGTVQHPRDWRWSSYRATSGEGRPEPWLHTKDLLRMFSTRTNEAPRHYRKFVEEGIGRTSPFIEAQHRSILGSPQFVTEMWERRADAEDESEIVLEERMIGRPALVDLFAGVETTQERDVAIVQARMRCGYSVSEIARHLSLHRTTVSKILHQHP